MIHRPILTRSAATRFALLAVATLAGSMATRAEDAILEQIEEPVRVVAAAPVPLETGTEIERYCSNIADAARDRRYVLQTQEMEALQKEVDKRIEVLEQKRAEYELWMKRREAFIEQAQENIVRIYSGMRPDAAAERLAEMDPKLAASILTKIEPRKAGVILNEMERKAAATLTGIMVAAARRIDPS